MGKKGFAGNKERKRGRKKSKVAAEAQAEAANEDHAPPSQPPQDGQPTWIARPGDEEDPTAPFGFVDSDVKTYFKDLFAQLKASEATVTYGDDAEEAADDSEHALLVQAALREADGRVLTLATDPDTSVVVEYLIGHLKGKAIRILMDRMSGSLFTLARHRFGSHVLQSTLTALQPLVSEEVQSGSNDSGSTDKELGHLRSPVKLILDAVDELQPHLGALVQDSFGTHILRVLLFILAGRPVSEGEAGKSASQPLSARSKRSSKYRTKEITSVVRAQEESEELPQVPDSFETLLERVRAHVLSDMGINEVHAIAVSPVAAPVLAIFLEFEARSPNPSTRPEAPNSLHDLLLDGLASFVHDHPSPSTDSLPEKTDFTETMLRDTVGSLTLQAALSTASSQVAFLFYKIYFSGRLIKLATHPVANFVASTLVRRLGWIIAQAREHLMGVTPQEGEEARALLDSVLEEIKAAGNKVIKEKKTSLFAALLEAASVADPDGTTAVQVAAVEALCISFWLSVTATPSESESTAEAEQERETLPVILSLQTRKDWIKTQAKKEKGAPKQKSGKKDAFSRPIDEEDESDSSDDEDEAPDHQPEPSAPVAENIQADTQGSLLLQTIAKLTFPANDILHRSLHRQTPETLLGLCQSPTAVHVILAMLSSSTTTFQQRKKLFELLLPQLGALADDRWGSRVGDALWDTADVFVRSKMVRQAQAQERHLLASQFGRFLLKRLNPGMFRKNQERWREWAKQFTVTPFPSLREETLQTLRTAAKGVPGFTTPEETKSSKRKREHEAEPSQGKKSKKDRKSKDKKSKRKSGASDGLDAELDAILDEAE